jgi:hypothetical protein
VVKLGPDWHTGNWIDATYRSTSHPHRNQRRESSFHSRNRLLASCGSARVHPWGRRDGTGRGKVALLPSALRLENVIVDVDLAAFDEEESAVSRTAERLPCLARKPRCIAAISFGERYACDSEAASPSRPTPRRRTSRIVLGRKERDQN